MNSDNKSVRSLNKALIELKNKNHAGFLGIVNRLFPKSLSIYVNMECNLDCLHCDCKREKYKLKYPELSAREWKKVIGKFADKRGGIVVIAGREPLLTKESRKKVAAILKESKKRGLRCGLVNNGHFFKHFSEEYPQVKMNFIDFSVEGLKGTHEKIRRGSCFELVESAVKIAVKRDIAEEVYISTTLTKMNYSELELLTDHFKKLPKIKHVFLSWVPKNDKEVFKKLYLSDDDFLAKVYPTIKRLSETNEILLDLFPSSFKNFENIQKKIIPLDNTYLSDSFIYAQNDTLPIRITSSLFSLITSIVAASDGQIVSMNDLTATSDFSSSAKEMICSALNKKQHPNLSDITGRLEEISGYCRNTFLLTFGEKFNFALLKKGGDKYAVS